MNTQTVDPRDVRPSAQINGYPVAGSWYPGSAVQLRETVDDLLAQAQFYPTQDELIGLISPHAGYAYSGQTAAYAYRQVAGRRYDLIVLLGPSHSDYFGPFAVTDKKYYATPLGLVPVAQEFIDELAQQVELARVDVDHEHSLEIQLPFLQRTAGVFNLVPVMVGIPLYELGAGVLEMCQRFANALAVLAGARQVLFVASSDLSHLYNYADVNGADARTAELVQGLDIPALAQYMATGGQCRACGDAPILIALLAARQLGANRAQVLYRTNSGDVTGQQGRGQYTVGYMAAGVYKGRTGE